MKEFNINQTIKVKLKEEGIIHYLQRMNKYMPQDQLINRDDIKTDEDGYMSFQMWHFMEIFGSTIVFGLDPIFDTTIKIEE